MGKGRDFPAINAVASVLRHHAQRIEWGDGKGEDAFCDVRLQVKHEASTPGVMAWWTIHVGPSDYDSDHRGWWGAACIPKGPFNSRAVAADLIEQARSQAAQYAEFHKSVGSQTKREV